MDVLESVAAHRLRIGAPQLRKRRAVHDHAVGRRQAVVAGALLQAEARQLAPAHVEALDAEQRVEAVPAPDHRRPDRAAVRTDGAAPLAPEPQLRAVAAEGQRHAGPAGARHEERQVEREQVVPF